MDIVANNIANMSTSGFRAQNPLFEEYLTDPRYNDDPMSFVYDYGQYQMTSQGSVQKTDNPFNVALNGPGFIGVQTPNGETAYTRDGNFQKREDGTLVTSSGLPVLGDGGPIVISNDATELNIDEKGNISDQNGPVARIMIVEFENVQELTPTGNNLYATEGDTVPAENTRVAQGYLEGSNVNSITEMTRMIEILREYQSTQKLLESEHERLRGAIRTLTRA